MCTLKWSKCLVEGLCSYRWSATNVPGPTPVGAIAMQPQMVQVPSSAGLVGQPQAVRGQMVQLPTSGTVASAPHSQSVHVPSSQAEGVQGPLVMVTPDGPEKVAHEAI